MTFTYDPTTDIGRVRRTLPDKTASVYFWTDEEIQSFLNDEGNWRRASALALETMASDSAMVLLVMKVQNITTDGAKVSDALLKRAAELRKQANIDEAATSGGSFDVIETVTDDFGYRQRLFNQALIDD